MISQRRPFSLIHVLQVHKELAVLGLCIWTIVKMRGAYTLGQSMVAGVGEVVAGVTFTGWWVSICDGVISCDPHSRGVGHSRHGRLFALLFLSVDDEEEEEKEHQQHKDDDSCDGSYLIGVHMHGCTGQTVKAAHHHHTGLVTASSFPAWVAVTRTGHMITSGVIQTVTDLTAAITIRTRRTLLLTVSAHEASATSALSRDVVTVSSIPTLAGLRTVFPIET